MSGAGSVSSYGSTTPVRMAQRTALTVDSTPSFWRIRYRWQAAVLKLILSRVATALVL